MVLCVGSDVHDVALPLATVGPCLRGDSRTGRGVVQDAGVSVVMWGAQRAPGPRTAVPWRSGVCRRQARRTGSCSRIEFETSSRASAQTAVPVDGEPERTAIRLRIVLCGFLRLVASASRARRVSEKPPAAGRAPRTTPSFALRVRRLGQHNKFENMATQLSWATGASGLIALSSLPSSTSNACPHRAHRPAGSVLERRGVRRPRPTRPCRAAHTQLLSHPPAPHGAPPRGSRVGSVPPSGTAAQLRRPSAPACRHTFRMAHPLALRPASAVPRSRVRGAQYGAARC